jgi:hypothetical protein
MTGTVIIIRVTILFCLVLAICQEARQLHVCISSTRTAALALVPMIVATVSTQSPQPLSQSPQQPLSDDPTLPPTQSPSSLRVTTATTDPRPQGLRLVMMGDSVTRYQYLSLAYFLRHGTWWNATYPKNLVNEKTFGSYDSFFRETSQLLAPYERCDCHRPIGEMALHMELLVENRYFQDPTRDNVLIYITAFGHPSNGTVHGRWKPQDALLLGESNFSVPDGQQYEWEHADWDWVISQYMTKLVPKPTHVLVNAGIWPNDFDQLEARTRLKLALQASNMTGIFKTTSYDRRLGPWRNAATIDPIMCRLLDKCLDILWSNCVMQRYMYDGIHFVEPIYRIFNEELLELVGHVFPFAYQRKNRQDYIRPNRALCWVLPEFGTLNATVNRIATPASTRAPVV